MDGGRRGRHQATICRSAWPQGFAWIDIEPSDGPRTAAVRATGATPSCGWDASSSARGTRPRAHRGRRIRSWAAVRSRLDRDRQPQLSSYLDRCTLQMERRTIAGESADGALLEVTTILDT
jgi:hypothetical protein